MATDTMDLERQLVVEKQRLRTSLHTIGTRASEAMDWRHQVRERPLEALGLAAVVGLVVGAVSARSAVASRPADIAAEDRTPPTTPLRSRPGPAFTRLKAGLAGLMADRVLLLAQDVLDGATRRRPR